jgi:hypothetical protein
MAMIIDALNNWRMETPKLFGFFHIFFIALTIIVSVLLVHHFRDSSEKTVKRILLISWITLVVLEIGKQLILNYEDGFIKFKWFNFPYQFCETPLYVIPILLVNKNEKVRNGLISYMASFVLFAGLAIILVPVAVISTSVFLNLRQFYGHGLQVALGIFLFVWNRKNMSYKTFLHGTYVFLIGVAIAFTLNLVIGYGFHKEINMFYIAIDLPSTLLILKDIKPYVPYIVYLLAYIVGFTGIAFGIYYVEDVITRRVYKINVNQKEKVELK